MRQVCVTQCKTHFLNHAVLWLRFLGWLDEAERENHPHHAEIANFARSEAFPRRLYKTIAEPPTTSSSDWREEARRWMQFRWPTSMMLLRQSTGGESWKRAGDMVQALLLQRAETAGIEAISLSPRLGDFNEDLHVFGLDALWTALRMQLVPEDVSRFLLVPATVA